MVLGFVSGDLGRYPSRGVDVPDSVILGVFVGFVAAVWILLTPSKSCIGTGRGAGFAAVDILLAGLFVSVAVVAGEVDDFHCSGVRCLAWWAVVLLSGSLAVLHTSSAFLFAAVSIQVWRHQRAAREECGKCSSGSEDRKGVWWF